MGALVEFRVENFDKESPLMAWLHLWAGKRGFPFDKELASDFGFMAYVGERPIASVFLYPVLSTSFVLIGFPLSDPNSTKEERSGAIKAIVADAEKVSKVLNRKFIVSYAGSKGAVSMFSNLGYEIADKDVIQYIKKLGD